MSAATPPPTEQEPKRPEPSSHWGVIGAGLSLLLVPALIFAMGLLDGKGCQQALRTAKDAYDGKPDEDEARKVPRLPAKPVVPNWGHAPEGGYVPGLSGATRPVAPNTVAGSLVDGGRGTAPVGQADDGVSPAAPASGALPLLDSFQRFAARYAVAWATSARKAFASAGGEEFSVSTSVGSTDVKQTDSVINPIVYELVTVTRVSKGDSAIWIVENRTQFVFRAGWWQPVKAWAKPTYDLTNTHPVGVETPIEPTSDEARIAQDLPPQ